MKLNILCIILISTLTFSQEKHHLNYFGEIGFGFTHSNYPYTNTGINSNISISVGSDRYLLRLSHKVNGVYSATYPKDKIRSTNLMFGKSFQLYHEFNTVTEKSLAWNVVLYSGLSAIQNQANVVIPGSNDSQTHLVLEDGYGFPIEMELQYLLPKYRGVALNVFYNFNKFRNFNGFSLSFIVGYF